MTRPKNEVNLKSENDLTKKMKMTWPKQKKKQPGPENRDYIKKLRRTNPKKTTWLNKDILTKNKDDLLRVGNFSKWNPAAISMIIIGIFSANIFWLVDIPFKNQNNQIIKED